MLLYWFFNLGVGVGGELHAPTALLPGMSPSTHCTGGLVGPRAGLDWCRKSRPPTGIRSLDRSTRSMSVSSAVGRENNQKGFNTAMRGHAEYGILSLMMKKT